MFALQQVLCVGSYWVCSGDELKPLAWLTSASGLSEPLSTLPQELMCAALAASFALGLLSKSCCSGQQELAVRLMLKGRIKSCVSSSPFALHLPLSYKGVGNAHQAIKTRAVADAP